MFAVQHHQSDWIQICVEVIGSNNFGLDPEPFSMQDDSVADVLL